MKLSLNKLLVFFAGLAVICLVVFIFWLNKNSGVIDEPGLVTDLQGDVQGSPIAGLACSFMERRPVAVMLASDPQARPLSGLGAADVVFEMPVTPDGITRMMAVFQCNEPAEVGSIRSARADFIPLAAGLGAVLVHWGGEKDALRALNGGIINNIDAMKYDGTVFYRKRKVPPPHNGFTTLERILDQAKKLSYLADNTFSGYSHSTVQLPRSLSTIATSIPVAYAGEYNVLWTYDETAGAYMRMRGGKPEIDAVTGEQVKASVVAVMETQSKFLSNEYISVDVVGQGKAAVYQRGIVTSGTWRKDDSGTSKLTFLDAAGREIKFYPGAVWVEIVTE